MVGTCNQEDKGIKAIVIANVDYRKLVSVVAELLQLKEVRKIYVTTGKSNLAIEITAKTVKSFHEFLTVRLSSIQGLSVASSNMVTQILKGNGYDGRRLGASGRSRIERYLMV